MLGEAAKNLSNEFRLTHTEIPWADIIKTRNKVIHHYFGIDFDILWLVVENELPKLKIFLDNLLNTF